MLKLILRIRVMHLAIVAVTSLIWFLPVSTAEEGRDSKVHFEETDEAGWRITGDSYDALIDGDGNFRKLNVRGVSFLAEGRRGGRDLIGGTFPGDKPADHLVRNGRDIVAERGDIRVEYRFDDTGFKLVSEGGQVNWGLSDNVRALVRRGRAEWGGSQDVSSPEDVGGDVVKIFANGVAVSTSEPFHISRGRLFPSFTTRGGEQADRFECRFKWDYDYDPAELVRLKRWIPSRGDPRKTAEYEPEEKPELRLVMESLAEEEKVELDLRFSARNHPRNGNVVFEKTTSITVPRGEEEEFAVEVPVNEPGLYWVEVDSIIEGEPWFSLTRGVIYDRDNYRPELTRPEDFDEFWDRQLKKMRDIPFEAELEKREDWSSERFIHYNLTLNDFDGDRLEGYLRLPRSDGPHNAEVMGFRGEVDSNVFQGLERHENRSEGVGMWQRGGERVRVGVPLPDESTYTRWESRKDNNMLESYLRKVRMMDYLRSLEEVDRIFIYGASRTGASALAATALSPEQVAAVNVHVPTSCGLSWSDHPYHGWGNVPGEEAGGLETAAYFDPVNFAPKLKVPLVMDGGFYDGLSPSAGIQAFYNHAVNAPFRRCAIEQGHHGHFEYSRRNEMEEELAEYLARIRQ